MFGQFHPHGRIQFHQQIFQTPAHNAFVQPIITYAGRAAVFTFTAAYHLYGVFYDLRHEFIGFFRISQAAHILIKNIEADFFLETCTHIQRIA